jgi:hypothetical protein
MSDINNGLNMEYIRTVHSEGIVDLNYKVNAHKNVSDTLWNNVEGEHSTRYSQLDGKVVNVDG